MGNLSQKIAEALRILNPESRPIRQSHHRPSSEQLAQTAARIEGVSASSADGVEALDGRASPRLGSGTGKSP